METNNEVRNKEKNKVSGALFVGCMFVGMGIGFFTGYLTAGLFIGMGVGFLASAAYRTRN
jgi:hypothetical protein